MPKRPAAGHATTFALLTVLAFVAYAPALDTPFVSDDTLAITGNELVTGPLQPIEIFSRFSWWGSSRADAPGYRPVVTLSFALTHALAGADPFWFHAGNVLIHALVSWLVVLLAIRVGLDRPASRLAGIAFCLLPIHSEAVIWSVGRAELFAAAAFAAAACLALDYRRLGVRGLPAAAGILLLAGLFSKENAVALIAAPFLASFCLASSPPARRRDMHLAGALLGALAVYLLVRASAGPLLGSAAGDRLDNPLAVLDLPARLLGALSVFGRYLWLTLWPHPLSIDYSFDALGIHENFSGDMYAALGLVAVAGLVAAALLRKRVPGIAFALGLSAASYSIVSNAIVPIGTAMAERLFYLPTLGLCLAAGPWLARTARWRQPAGAALLFVIAATWTAVLWARASDWSSPVRLFEAAVDAYPRSARAHMELATAYGRTGRFDEAVEHFRQATEILPGYAAAWYNLANLYARRARWDEALSAYDRALETAPGLAAAHYNRALTLLARGDAQAAAEAFAAGETKFPHDPAFTMGLADAYLALGRYQEAAAAYGRVLEREPAALAARVNRGVALQHARGCEAALEEYRDALAQRPNEPTALANAVACLRWLGRPQEAAALSEAARKVANPQRRR